MVRNVKKKDFQEFPHIFPGSSGICLEANPLTIDTVVTLGQGELRDKAHLSHRCFALEARNAPRLRRR
jgi:hypothetical protein